LGAEGKEANTVPVRLKSVLTYSNVMSSIAVFLALGAGAYAASTFVTSRGVIHGCVAKGGQLTLVKPAAKCPKGGQPIAWNQQGAPGQSGGRGAIGSNGAAGWNGAPGANGPAGAGGANGAQGARGPSDGYAASFGEGTGSARVSVTVPAGDYVAQGGCSASQLKGTKDGSAIAELRADNDSSHSDAQVATVPFDGLKLFNSSVFGRANLSTHAGFHLPAGGTITETCGDESGSEVTGMSYDNLKVTAIQVGLLHP
jgi:hypothetical protein